MRYLNLDDLTKWVGKDELSKSSRRKDERRKKLFSSKNCLANDAMGSATDSASRYIRLLEGKNEKQI